MSLLRIVLVVLSLASMIHGQGGCAWVGPNSTCPAHCTWNCPLSLCYDATCPQFTTASSCQSVSGCSWANDKCRDYNLQYGSFPNCALATTADACGGSCQWSTFQQRCIARGSACAWLPQRSSASCPDQCTYGQSIGYCYDAACSALTTSSACAGRSGCTWSNGYCYDYNLQYSGYACSKATEYNECPSSRCHWDGATGACLDGAVPADSTPAPAPSPVADAGGCAWVSNPTAATCPAHCTFDATLNICYDANCIHLHTPAACSGVSGCAWSKGQCRDYNLLYGSITCANSNSPLTCGGSCQWKWSTNTCVSGSPSSACTWLTQNSAAACPDRCAFNALTGHCYESTCLSAKTQCACNQLSNAGCSWSNNRCLDYNVQYGSYACANVNSEAECGRSCVWDSATHTCSG